MTNNNDMEDDVAELPLGTAVLFWGLSIGLIGGFIYIQF